MEGGSVAGQSIIDRAVDVVRGDNGDLQFLAPGAEFSISDPFGLVERVAVQCEAGTSREAIVETFSPEPLRQAADSLLQDLARRRILADKNTISGGDVLADWLRHYAGASDKTLPPVSVRGFGHVAAALTRTLADFGFDVAAPAASADGVIACCDTPDMGWLREMNMEAFAQKRPFLPVWLDRAAVNWGPFVVPGATACLECLWHRRQAAQRLSEPPPVWNVRAMSVSPALAELAAVLAGGEVLRWGLAAHVEFDPGMSWRFDMLSLDLNGAVVMKLPRCPVCGYHA